LYPGRYQSRPEAPGFTPSLGGKECWIPPFNADNHFCQDMQAITPVPHELCVALDCEMVGVGRQKSSVLARVSLVDYRGIAIFDTFVRVEEKVTDYRTAVSGVRPQDLESPNAMDYGTCRWVVQGLLAGKILVGHALENDLKVLNLNHPWDQVRDTSVHPPFMKSNPHTGAYQARRLCHLTQSFLGKKIQQYEHDSLEDARAAMDLYMLVKPDWDYTVEFWSRQSRSTLHSQPSYDQRHGRKHYTTQRRHHSVYPKPGHH
jgi:RNA exonuclease 4